MKRFVLVLFFLFSLVESAYSTGEISSFLRQKIDEAQQTNAMVRALIIMKDQVDILALDQRLYAEQASAQRRAYTVITSLQEKARTTQDPIVSYIQSQSSNRVLRFEPYWIANIIAIEAVPAVLLEVSNRDDVALMDYDHIPVVEDAYDFRPAADNIPDGSEPGLRAVNAHKLWQMGITGRGRLVMNVDTGVEGSHPSFAARWRGNRVPSSQAWLGSGTFPNDCSDHGSHTMGTIVGRDSVTRDTVGVAPDAEWIAAQSITCPTHSPITAFQWALDPDGNPSTTDDMPDVISNSWGFGSGGGCETGSYGPILNSLAAAGIAVVFSAGNSGPSPGTITGPKNINTTLVNSWATGNIDGNGPSQGIATLSSRGPSGCGGTGSLLIKPEAVAPGTSVRSAVRGGGYALFSGTSMACPHVAGAIALLKQMYPNKTGEELKLALYYTAKETPADLASNDPGEPSGQTSGEDNNYGNGIIDVFAAAGYLSPYQVYGTIRSSANNQPVNGAKVAVLQTGQDATTGAAGTYNIGPLRDTVQLRFSAFAHYDTTISRILTANVAETLNVTMQSFPLAQLGGTITDSLSGSGIVAAMSFFAQGDPLPGPRYTTTSQSNGSYSVNATVGTYNIVALPVAPYSDTVTAHNVVLQAGGTTLNFKLLEAEILYVDDDGGTTTEGAYKGSLARLNFRRRFHSVAQSGLPAAVLASFTRKPALLWATGLDSTNALTTAERQLIVNHLSGGGKAILTGHNIAQFSAPTDTLVNRYLGIQFTGNTATPFIRGFAGDVIGDGVVSWVVTGSSKDILTRVTGSIGTPTGTLYYGTDTTQLAGVRTLGPSATWGATFFGFGLEDIAPARQDTFILRSMRFFNQSVVSVGDPVTQGVPTEYALEQNYPNPFNPMTKIQFRVASLEFVELSVFDVLGRKVAALVNERKEPGTYQVEFDGEGLASGVYLYRLQAGRFVKTHKMLLLK